MAYNVLEPVKILEAQDMGASFNSNPVEIQLQDNIGVQLRWTGTPTGSFSIQVSNNYRKDYMGNVQDAGNWITLTLSASIAAAGSADDAYIDLNQLGAMYMRIVYTRVSGSGACSAWVTGKGI